MATYILMFFISCCFLLTNLQAEHYLTVCAIFQNEAPYLKEWIEYHRLVGVEKFYLYNNHSKDDYQTVLLPYIHNGTVELADWPTGKEEPFISCQKRAYNHCIAYRKEEAFWIAFIDLDEFILPVQQTSLCAVLKEYENYGGLFIYWQNFGTSHISSLPKDNLLIETLVMKYPWDAKGNRIGKSIVRPKKIFKYSLHNGSYLDGSHTVTTDRAIMDETKDFSRPPVIDKIQLNHYFTRTEDYFLRVKIARKQKIKPELVWTDKKIKRKLEESNVVRDDRILKFVPELKKQMNLSH